MKRRSLATLCAIPGLLFFGVPHAQAGDVCWIHRAERDGDSVRVVFSKGLMPPGAIIHPNGTKDFVNGAALERSGRVVEQNPHTFVVLHKGDKLGLIGMDSGCTVAVVRVQGRPELKMSVGNSFVHFMPIDDEKSAAVKSSRL